MSAREKTLGNRNFDSIDAFLRKLVQSIKAKETVVFCGAGISRHSGLPIVNELVPYILGKLGVTPEETQTIMNSNLPFEAFMETLRSNSDVDKIFDIFNLGEPNTNHILLAKLAKAGFVTTICTTNFDCLIEKAFDSEGLVSGRDYQVYYKETDFERIQWNDHPIHLIKIHGSVEDKDNMAITLKQVSSQVFSSQRQKVIEHIFSSGLHGQVLIMGYSCSDVFDLSLHIEAVGKNGKKVLLIDHHKNESAIKDLTEKQGKNPFRHFGESRWILYNTDNVVKAIWESCFAQEEYILPQSVINKAVWEKYVHTWSSEMEEKYSEASKYSIAGQIFYKISEFKNAIRYFEQALRITRKIGDKQKEGSWLGNLGNAYRSLGDYRKAIDYYEEALTIAREIGDKQNERGWLDSLGNVYDKLGDYWNAIDYYGEALTIAREIGNKEGEGSSLGSLGITYMNLGGYRKAIDYYEEALTIAREIGDKGGEGSWLGNLGNIYRSLGEYQKAIDYFEQALTITRNISDRQNEENCLGNLGIAYDNLGEYGKAIGYYEEALTIAREIGDKGGEGSWLGNLGVIYMNLGEYRKAIDYYENALTIAKKIGYKRGEGSWLGNLGKTFQILGEYEKAIGYYKQALDILRPVLGNNHLHVKLFAANLSVAQSLMERIDLNQSG
jgi:tetratricopeptide (TPR) repeat protein/NAD-dependent SIR2 family protein deacetylase